MDTNTTDTPRCVATARTWLIQHGGASPEDLGVVAGTRHVQAAFPIMQQLDRAVQRAHELACFVSSARAPSGVRWLVVNADRLQDLRDQELAEIRAFVASSDYSHTNPNHSVSPDRVHVYRKDPTSPTGHTLWRSIRKDDAEALAILRSRFERTDPPPAEPEPPTYQELVRALDAAEAAEQDAYEVYAAHLQETRQRTAELWGHVTGTRNRTKAAREALHNARPTITLTTKHGRREVRLVAMGRKGSLILAVEPGDRLRCTRARRSEGWWFRHNRVWWTVSDADVQRALAELAQLQRGGQPDPFASDTPNTTSGS